MEENHKYRIEQLEKAAISRKIRLDWMIGIAITMIGSIWMYIGTINSNLASTSARLEAIQAELATFKHAQEVEIQDRKDVDNYQTKRIDSHNH